MRSRLAYVPLLVIPPFGCLSTPAAADGPFGVTMGSDISTYSTCVKSDKPTFYTCRSLPRRHPEFESYVIQAATNIGVCRVKGIGRTVSSNSFGSKLKSTAKELSEQIALTYGQPKFHDEVMTGSMWNEPEDWMMANVRGELVYGYWWEDSNMPNNVKSIFLSAEALNLQSGILIVEFSFENAEQCDMIVRKEEAESF